MKRDVERIATLFAVSALVACVAVAPVPAGAVDSPPLTALNGVSCADATTCVAVGTRVISALNKTLVKSWNGTSWSVVASPNPPGKTIAILNAVNCSSTTSCVAVGTYSTKSWSRTLIEQWNGTAWSIAASPNPPGQTLAVLSGVTCASSTSCVAVGNYSTKSWSRTLIERWNGTTWAIAASPNPHGLNFAALDSLACPSSTSCIAVGNYSTKSWSRTLLEQWNGTSWAIVASPNPPGLNFAIVDSISCPDATTCHAVGLFTTGTRTKTLVERWNGSRWSIVASPNPVPGVLEFAGLGAVACAGTADCYAVGFAVTTTGAGSRALIEHWNGTTWLIDPGPIPSGTLAFPALLGVACASSANCHAVGFASNKTLIDHWDGTKWSTDTT
jgi:hypothetical protein